MSMFKFKKTKILRPKLFPNLFGPPVIRYNFKFFCVFHDRIRLSTIEVTNPKTLSTTVGNKADKNPPV